MVRNAIIDYQSQAPSAVKDESSSSGQRAAREILILCATSEISGSRKEQISRVLAGTVDWRYLLKIAEFHGIAPLIAHNFVTSGLINLIPQHYSKELNQTYTNTLYKNIILSDELAKILAVFNQHGIPAIALKGTTLAEQLYGNPALRTLVDTDILVRPKELSRAGSLLMDMGYQKVISEHSWEHPFHDTYQRQLQFPSFVELHWNLDDQELVSVPQQAIWHRAQSIQIQGSTIRVLSSEDTLLFLSNHLSKEFVHMMKSLCDITELLKKYNGTLDWGYIMESAGSWGVKCSVYYSLRMAQDILEAPVPVSVIRALKPNACRRWLLDFLLNKKDFISTTRLTKLRAETQAIIRGLMMKHPRQILMVLSRNRGPGEKAAWLRTAFWILLAFGAALGRNMARVVSGGSP
jgi:hypothetical protein